MFCGIHLTAISQWVPNLIFCILMNLTTKILELLPKSPRGQRFNSQGLKVHSQMCGADTEGSGWAMSWAVIELWPSCDWAVIILRMLWLSCDLAVTELWPSRDWAVTSPWLSCDLSYDWAVIIGPGAVTTVVTVSSRWAHSELTVSSRWQFFSHGLISRSQFPPVIYALDCMK